MRLTRPLSLTNCCGSISWAGQSYFPRWEENKYCYSVMDWKAQIIPAKAPNFRKYAWGLLQKGGKTPNNCVHCLLLQLPMSWKRSQTLQRCVLNNGCWVRGERHKRAKQNGSICSLLSNTNKSAFLQCPACCCFIYTSLSMRR